MAGFMTGFAQGWHAEKDRIEKRKMFEEELKLKREATLLELAPKYASARVGGFGGGTSGGSDGGTSGGQTLPKSHYEQMLAGYGVSADKIATLSSKGDTTALKTFVDFLESGRDKDYPWTAEEVDAAADTAVISVVEGRTVDFSPLMSRFGMSSSDMSPEGQYMLEQMTQVPGYTKADFTYQRQRPLKREDIDGFINMLDDSLVSVLQREMSVANQAARELPEGAERTAAAQRAASLEGVIAAAEEGNSYTAVQEVLKDPNLGAEMLAGVLNPVLSYDSRLKGLDLGITWNPIKEALLNPEKSASEPPKPKEATGSPSIGDTINWKGKVIQLTPEGWIDVKTGEVVVNTDGTPVNGI